MTQYVEYERFLPDVIGEINDCPEIIAINEIRNTVIDLCKTALLWRIELDTIPVKANNAVYDIDPDNMIKAAGLEWGYMTTTTGDTVDLSVTTEDMINANSFPSWRTDTGEPSLIYMISPEQVRLVNIPEKDYTLYCGIWAYPARDSYECPEFIFEKYLETVAHGAKARILSQKTRPWYDPSAASEEEFQYLSKRKDAMNDGRKSHSRAKLRVRMRPLA